MQNPPLTKNEIISRLYVSKDFCDCIGKMEPAHLREDLKAEVIAIVCEWPEERIAGLYQRNELHFFVARVVINQIQSDTSPFYRKFRRSNLVYVDDPEVSDEINPARKRHFESISQRVNRAVAEGEADINDRHDREELEDYTIEQINHLPFYECEMVKLYMKEGSYRAMHKATKIPHPSCFKTVQKALHKLRNQAEIKKAKTIFTKEELRFIQNKKP